MTDIRKNQYEEIIDAMMIDEVSGLDMDIKSTLESLPTDKKRLAILSILDKDRNMFVKIKNIISNTDVTKVEYIKGVVEMLREYVSVGEVEVKRFGEIMSPIFLIEEMMDTLPSDVWGNPELKWLDNCSGVGTFSAVIVNRLMDGLSIVFPNENDRYKHIMENMIYVAELQPKNMFLFLVAFDPKDEYELNVYTGSYLDEGFNEHKKEVWGVDKFDISVMNPPYQMRKEGNKKTQPLWHLFVEKTIESDLVDDGYLCAVHPSGWRSIKGRFKKTQIKMLSNQINYLEIHDADDGKKTFGATTRYDFYCLKKTTPKHKTKIVGQDGKIERVDISKMEFIPNGMFKEVISLIAKGGEESVQIINNSMYHHTRPHMSKIQDNQFRYPCVANINTKGEIGNVYYSMRNDRGHFGISKIIVGRFGINVFIDELGEFGLTEDGTGIVDTVENLKRIKIVLKNKRFLELNRMTDVAGLRDVPLNHKIIATFRKDFWGKFI